MGWDIAVAEAADWAGVPFVAAIPFPGQSRHWTGEDIARYDRALTLASKLAYISTIPGTSAYIKRDRWIVDHCEELHALDSGRRSGSHTTVLYAEEIGRKVVPLWEDWVRFRA